MLNIHQKFCKETFYNGQLAGFEPVYEKNFNFAYDVIDEIAKAEPERRAMLWCNDKGEEHTFSFADISKYSNMAANMFTELGIKRGDTVVLILKGITSSGLRFSGSIRLGQSVFPQPTC